MRKIKAIIVDDVQDAIDVLHHLIQKNVPQIEIVGSAHSVVEAVKLMQRTDFDVVFLDVQLPDGTGFDVLEMIHDRQFTVVFTTASDQHAIRAFQFAAFDYLLKPIAAEDLIRAMSRYERHHQDHHPEIDVLLQSWRRHDQLEQLVLHTEDMIHIVQLDEVIRCEASSNYTIFFKLDQTKIVVSHTIKHYEQLLTDKGYYRCHQSHMINLKHLKKYLKQDGGYVELTDGSIVPVSQRKKSALLSYLRQSFQS